MTILKSMVFMALLVLSARATAVPVNVLSTTEVVGRCQILMIPTIDTICAPVSRAPQEVGDFLKSSPAAQPSPDAKITVTENKVINAPVLAATDANGRLDELNAVRASNAKLKQVKRSGTQVFATREGMAIVAYGFATYDCDASNPNQQAEAQRFGSVEAHLNAKKALAKFLKGQTTEGKVAMTMNTTIMDTNEATLANTERKAKESVVESIEHMIHGAVVFDMHDDFEKREVSVSVVASPRTIGAVQATSVGTLTAKSIEDGLAFVLNEIELGLVPPVGGRFVVVESTGQFYWIGFGSELAKVHKNKATQGILKDTAKKGAALKANNALLAIINGERISAGSEFEKEYERTSAEFDGLTNAAKPAESIAAMCRTATRDNVESVAAGKLPPGIIMKDYERGAWMYSIGMYNPEISAAAKELAREMQANSPLRVSPLAVKGGFKTNPDGSFKTDENGKLIPESLGSGQVTKKSDL